MCKTKHKHFISLSYIYLQLAQMKPSISFPLLFYVNVASCFYVKFSLYFCLGLNVAVNNQLYRLLWSCLIKKTLGMEQGKTSCIWNYLAEKQLEYDIFLFTACNCLWGWPSASRRCMGQRVSFTSSLKPSYTVLFRDLAFPVHYVSGATGEDFLKSDVILWLVVYWWHFFPSSSFTVLRFFASILCVGFVATN